MPRSQQLRVTEMWHRLQITADQQTVSALPGQGRVGALTYAVDSFYRTVDVAGFCDASGRTQVAGFFATDDR